MKYRSYRSYVDAASVLGVLLVLFCVPAASDAEQGTVICESVGGARSYCPAETGGGVSLVRQLSTASCDQSWGWDDNGIWVDNGCRAEFQVGTKQDQVQAQSSLVGDLLGMLGGRQTGSSQSSEEGLLLCESINGRYVYCEADTSGGVELERRISKTQCDESWGFDKRGIWVDRGCRAEFRLLKPEPEKEEVEEPTEELSITCGTSSGSRAYCPADTSGGVRLVRQLSTASCTRNWGYDSGGIWTDNGCQGKFAVIPAGGTEPEREGLLVCRSQSNLRSFCGADTTGGVRLVRQLSMTSCTGNWGWNSAGVWVDKGCEGEFQMGGESTTGISEQRLVVCESRDGRLAFCAADTSRGARLVRQLGNAECSASWGWDVDGVWVDNGCRGEFELNQAEAGDSDQVVVVVCESREGGRAFCGVHTSHGGRLRRQLSTTTCTGRWGWESDGIWVDEGCRAEFELRLPTGVIQPE